MFILRLKTAHLIGFYSDRLLISLKICMVEAALDFVVF